MLILSQNTVKTHLARYRKLGVHSRSSAVARPRALGICDRHKMAGPLCESALRYARRSIIETHSTLGRSDRPFTRACTAPLGQLMPSSHELDRRGVDHSTDPGLAVFRSTWSVPTEERPDRTHLAQIPQCVVECARCEILWVRRDESAGTVTRSGQRN